MVTYFCPQLPCFVGLAIGKMNHVVFHDLEASTTTFDDKPG